MPICYCNFGEKDSVTSWAPTNSPSPFRTLGQPLIFGFETIRTISTCIQLVTTKFTNYFGTFERVGQLRSYDRNVEFLTSFSVTVQKDTILSLWK